MFTIAHFSDAHLAPLPRARIGELAGKRFSGWLSWQLNRRKIHQREVLDRLIADIAAHRPDHIAFTGDLVNLALAREVAQARAWLEALGSPRDVSMVPGNHDAYTQAGKAHLLAELKPWMEGDTPATPAFPFVRFRRNVAIIGVSSAIATPLFQASGEAGMQQLRKLESILRQTREKGFARIVMIHHPPLPGLASPRKCLKDAEAFAAVIARQGAELLLHGHNHLLELHEAQGPQGAIACLGLPSASALPYSGHPGAAWALINLRRQDGAWSISATIRSHDPATGAFDSAAQWNLA